MLVERNLRREDAFAHKMGATGTGRGGIAKASHNDRERCCRRSSGERGVVAEFVTMCEAAVNVRSLEGESLVEL